MNQLLLPGCGPHVVRSKDTRPPAVSLFAMMMLLLLLCATCLFGLANMYGDASWSLEVCNSTQNFCQHPEWTGVASVVMGIVYWASRGME